MSMLAMDRYLEFVNLPPYTRTAKGLISEDEQRWLEQTLIEDPHSGDTVRGAGGVRKIRVALSGGGKSGGARVIYFYRAAIGRVYLILAYGKNRKGSITDAERNEMKKFVRILEEEP